MRGQRKNPRKAVQPFENKKRKIDIFKNYEANGVEKIQRKLEIFSTLISKKSRLPIIPLFAIPFLGSHRVHFSLITFGDCLYTCCGHFMPSRTKQGKVNTSLFLLVKIHYTVLNVGFVVSSSMS